MPEDLTPDLPSVPELPATTLLFERTGSPLVPFRTAGGRMVAEVGRFDEDFRFHVDLSSGEVLFGLVDDPGPVHVNASLAVFAACLLAFDARCPFYLFEDGTETKRAAGREPAAALTAIDPTALGAPGAFWPTLVHDVESGDCHEGSV